MLAQLPLHPQIPRKPKSVCQQGTKYSEIKKLLSN